MTHSADARLADPLRKVRGFMRSFQLVAGAVLILAFGQHASALVISSPGGLPVSPAHVVTFSGEPTGAYATDTFLAPNLTITGSQNLDGINTDSFGASTTFPDFVDGVALGIRPAVGVGGTITLTFTVPVTQVGLGIFDPNFVGTMVEFFGVGDVLLATQALTLFPPGGSGADYVGLVPPPISGIAKVVVTAGPGDHLWIDNVAYGVPEPTTLALLGIALAGLSFARRRKLH